MQILDAVTFMHIFDAAIFMHIFDHVIFMYIYIQMALSFPGLYESCPRKSSK